VTDLDAYLARTSNTWASEPPVASSARLDRALRRPGRLAALPRTSSTRLRARAAPRLTASAGIAIWSERMTADQLVAGADRALYRATSEGRDRACLAVSPGPGRG
jgi:GGDEF domain-containing protein